MSANFVLTYKKERNKMFLVPWNAFHCLTGKESIEAKEMKEWKRKCMKMAARRGSLSINSDNIFPIIKKWLYSDHDIFYRELISNGCDAITKLKKLDMMGEYSLPEEWKAKIQVIVNPEEKTLKFIDNGL